MASPTDIRKGKVINFNGTPHIVLDTQHRTQGRQAGFVQTTMRNLNTGSTTSTKYRGTDSVDFLMTDTVKLEFSYTDQEGFHFLHPVTFGDTVLTNELVEYSKDYLCEGNLYDILFVDERAVQIQLPASIEMKIVVAAEGLRGDTASSALKPVTTETGMVVQAPLFIKVDDVIKISTSDRSYLGRI